MDCWKLSRAIACALGLIAAAQVDAQEETEEEPFLPGLIAEYQQAGIEPIQMLEPVIAGNWTDRPDGRLVAGKLFTVTYRGLLLVPDDGTYQLHLHGNGAVQIKLNGKLISPKTSAKGWTSSSPQTLSFGPLPLEVTFTATAWPARVSLFWSSDRFEREPIPARALAHDRTKTLSTEFERGRVLARALRCEACHSTEQATSAAPLPAPALDNLLVNRNWLKNWLANDRAHDTPVPHEAVADIRRRMPYLPLTPAEAESITDWLLTRPETKKEPRPQGVESPDKKTSAKPDKPVKSKTPRTNAELHQAGEQLLLTKGCIACHQKNAFGESSLFGGGDLTYIAGKRPREFFAQWLQSPAALNRDHRMPLFELPADEREALVFVLSVSGMAPSSAESKATGDAWQANAVKARELVRKHRCDQCHRLPQEKDVAKLTAPPSAPALTRERDWKKSCAVESAAAAKSLPQFAVPKGDAAALEVYFTQRRVGDAKSVSPFDGAQLLIENNCLACHAREPQPAGVLPKKFGDKLVQLAGAHADLAPQIPAMTPPSLNSVGDKLNDQALANAITRAGPAHRPYLLVQMPKFRLSKEQTEALAGHFINLDRIPDYERTGAHEPTPTQLAAQSLAGKRLVGTDGFSCTACHQVGSVQPVKAPPNARGPTLSMPQDRLRKTWFDRWCRNPARIVPRMEMPSVQVPVRGVLQDNLHDQLAAVWQVLSTPGFEPPLPEPVRVLRFYSSEGSKDKQPLVITDLIEHEGQTLERAMLVGLPNRHNILFDFATNRLLSWSQGDLARQRTKGKNWYWESAGSPLLETGLKQSEFAFEVNGQMWEPVAEGQWLAELGHWQLTYEVPSFDYKLRFQRVKAANGEKPIDVFVRQSIEPRLNPADGFDRRCELGPVPRGAKVHWRMLDADKHEIKPSAVTIRNDGLTMVLRNRGEIHLAVNGSPAKFTWLPEGTAVMEPSAAGGLSCSLRYKSMLPRDEYHVPRQLVIPYIQLPITIAPGFTGQRLTLPTNIMPTALAWRPNGDLVVASLMGQVHTFNADSLDSLQPHGRLLAEGLAAPYGLHAGADFVDVITKSALVRLIQHPDLQVNEFLTLASGWGYTSDYHDWAVGLPRDAAGNYYVALPCFQDNRAEPAKRLRGSVLKLAPRRLTDLRSPAFDIQVMTHGHRFPMGMALNDRDELFVSDNQGNYNPFNELNWVRPGKHFGFVNKGEEKPQEPTAPTIAIPHPWTRSVNGICFLNTPKQIGGRPPKEKMFGPLEGQLVGCEYDTRRLIRMSLQKVGDDYQGCCYPLTVPMPADQSPLGPICCEISPAGDLTIGSIRDSGWGAGNNIGEVIRVKFDAEKLGHGLAEMRAIVGGFELHFFQPVNEALATDIANYSLSSYRRESTPAYGGNDIDRRTEKVSKATLSADRQRVTLALDNLRAGHVYELRLKSLAADDAPFFPAEAHYTLRQLVR